ncbi:hypothetical protein, partial [Dactylosporangium sp. NPDC000521]|uniref:hypothetical protein n=1 Tax=Dactylosporangium sp. NPDC000521 TaxID=3363975 RepID=UPI0036962589
MERPPGGGDGALGREGRGGEGRGVVGLLDVDRLVVLRAELGGQVPGRAKDLLTYLALHRAGAELSDIMEALWPDAT